MEWHESKNIFAMAKDYSGESIEHSLTEFCRYIKDHIIPKNDGIAWDYLRIEFWADSGRMIAFPASTSTSDRIERAGCQVVFTDLLAQYESLADSDLDDDMFLAKLLDAERAWIDRFLHSARDVSLTGTRIQFWDGDGEHPIWDCEV